MRSRGTLVKQPGVVEIHDLLVWEVTSGFPALSAHVLVRAESDCHGIRRELEHELHEYFETEHTTCKSTTKAKSSFGLRQRNNDAASRLGRGPKRPQMRSPLSQVWLDDDIPDVG